VEGVVNQMEVAFAVNESDPTVEVLQVVGLDQKMDESAVEEVQIHVVDSLDDVTIGLVEGDLHVGEEVDCYNSVRSMEEAVVAVDFVMNVVGNILKYVDKFEAVRHTF
jgi:hypothetical protein